MKPLYVNGRPGTRIALDGPALKLSLPARADTLYPLGRLSRVVTSGAVDWSTEALLACAERGISVTFLRRDGAVRGYLFGESDRRETLWQRLRDLLDRPDWQARYADWCANVESQARRALCRRLGLDPQRLPPARLARAVADLAQSYAGPTVFAFVERRLRGLLAALVAELLAGRGLGAAQLRVLGERLALVHDLAALLAWDLHLPVLELLQRRHAQAAGGLMLAVSDAELVRLFEARAERLRRLGETLLSRLHGWLVDLDG